MIAPKTPQLILEKAGLEGEHDQSKYVVETSILPFFSSVDFVFCLAVGPYARLLHFRDEFLIDIKSTVCKMKFLFFIIVQERFSH